MSNLIQNFKEKCIFCVKSKKECIYYGNPGEFLCERCRNKNVCWFLCEVCKKTKDGNLFDPCPNCKVTTKDPPEKYTTYIDTYDQRPYLKHSKCNHRIEITAALLDEMATLYTTYHMTSNSLGLSNVILASLQFLIIDSIPIESTPISSIPSTLPHHLYASNAFVWPTNLSNVPSSYVYDPRIDLNLSIAQNNVDPILHDPMLFQNDFPRNIDSYYFYPYPN
ncbi:hypothetical protein F8M41_002278 [Gigaspora margarita]|uniref:Uncharacterized protein n=1 Tax=Gigaspora margarita TaxID=4874 RepID=A0A8H3XDT1_GIGMA|nr:hypothetical protein F8M41_002278 [Gigaspora margarita]